jgi:hypothetical protein
LPAILRSPLYWLDHQRQRPCQGEVSFLNLRTSMKFTEELSSAAKVRA